MIILLFLILLVMVLGPDVISGLIGAALVLALYAALLGAGMFALAFAFGAFA